VEKAFSTLEKGIKGMRPFTRAFHKSLSAGS